MGCQQSSLESLIEQLAGDDADRVYSACCELRNSLCGSFDNRKRAVEAGAIEAVVAAMRRHVTHAQLQNRACGTLSSLLLVEGEGRARAVKAGALEACLKALQTSDARADNLVWAVHDLLVKGSGPKATECRMRALDLGLLQQLQQRLPTLDITRQPCQKTVDLLSQLREQAPAVAGDPSKKEALRSGDAGAYAAHPRLTGPFTLIFSNLHVEAEERRKASTNGSFLDTGSTYASDSTTEESTKSAPVPDGLALPASSTAGNQLRDRLRNIPLGIRVCETLDEIYQRYQTARQANGDECLQACCQDGAVSNWTCSPRHLNLRSEFVLGYLDTEGLERLSPERSPASSSR